MQCAPECDVLVPGIPVPGNLSFYLMVSEKFGTEKVLEPVLKKFSTEKSLGTGPEKIWYRKSLGIGLGKIWYRKKVSEPASEKFGSRKKSWNWYRKIWYWNWFLLQKFRNLENL